MFTTLLESRAQRAKRNGSSAMSALVHGALITAAALLSTGRGIAAPVPPEPTLVHIVPLAPQPPTPSRRTSSAAAVSSTSAAPTLHHVDIDIPVVTPVGIPPIDFGRPAIDEGAMLVRTGDASPRNRIPGGIESGGVHDAAFVDRAPSVVGNAQAPRYPAVLRAGGTEGHVIVRFVVDTSGRAEMDGLVVKETSHPLFAEAVRNALGSYRFVPGEVAGRKVRTMVEMPFTFSLR